MINFINSIGTQQISFVEVYGKHWPRHSVYLYAPFQIRCIRYPYQLLIQPNDLNIRDEVLSPEIIESKPSTPNLLLVLSLSFKKLLNDYTLESSYKIVFLYWTENYILGIFSISCINQDF